MIVIRSNWFHFKGRSLCLFPFVLTKKCFVGTVEMNRNKIRYRQQAETLIILYYMWYVVNWLICLVYGESRKSISFEREIDTNEDNFEYVKTRKLWAWRNYID